MDRKDVIILGGGPAGLTAGIYASRELLKTLLIEKQATGGLPATTDLIENYPGFPDGINGIELMRLMRTQAQKFGTEIQEYEEVKSIIPQGRKIIVKTNKEQYEALSVIIATGSVPKPLNIHGEREFTGRGVSYCATCDGPLYRNKKVAIVGGGNAAAEEALFLSKFAQEVILVHRRSELRATEILQKRLHGKEKIKFLLNHNLISINGNDMVTSITVKDRESGEEKEVKVSGVFVYVGLLPNSNFVKGVVELDEKGYIVTNAKMETSVPGIFAVGDIRSNQVRQISTACGNAVTAVINAEHYIREIRE
ncbi:MAG: thioredoxin-disulfide reductase [Candidatus Cloacimonadia bacterium]